MTNAKKYLKDGVDGGKFVKELVKRISRFDSCKYYSTEMEHEIVLFLEQPVTPTLTEDERVILRNIQKDVSKYIEIGKDVSGLYLVEEIDNIHSCKEHIGLFSHLFQFIKERRRI